MKKSRPEISVIMPVYNAEAYLSAAIKSILSQTFSDFEFLIFNDGSTDDSLKVIESFNDPRINLINSAKNLGKEAQLNHGLEIAKVKYIAHMDGDDVSVPNRFARQIEAMKNNPQIDVCGTFLKCFGMSQAICAGPQNHREIVTYLSFAFNCMGHAPTMIRAEKLKESGIIYKENYPAAEDYAFWVHVSKFLQLYNLPEILYLYRIHDSSTCSTKKGVQKESVHRLHREIIADFGDFSPANEQSKIDLVYKFLHLSVRDFSSAENRIIKKFLEKAVNDPSIDRETFVRIIGSETYDLFS